MSLRGKAAKLSGAVVATVLVTGCAGASTDVEVVAGGGDDPNSAEAAQIRLDGAVADLAVGDGTVHLLAERGSGDHGTEETVLLTIDADGAAAEVYVDDRRQRDAKYLEHVAAGPDGSAYVAGARVIYRVEETELEAVYEVPSDGDEANITGLAVGATGDPIWAERFWNGGEPGSSYLTRIQRLSDGTVTRVAGTDASTDTFEEHRAREAAPPAGIRAADMPLVSAGSHGTLAADGDGNVYAATEEHTILRFGTDGEVGVVTGPGESPTPQEPFDDEGPADTFNGNWQDHYLLELADVTASGDRVVAIDGSPSNGPMEATDFRWNPTGAIDDGTQQVLDEIGEAYPVDDGYYPGAFAVLIEDGTAATVAGHAAGVALDGDLLYIAGQTGYLPSQDPEILIAAVDLTVSSS